MKNKGMAIIAGSVALLMAALYVLSFFAGHAGYQNLLLVTPSSAVGQGISPDKLDELTDKFLRTYEVRSSGTVQTTGSRHSVTIIGTNQSYASVMGYSALDGGFFTKAAMDQKLKYTVLNETAAFQIFGSAKVSGNTFKIGGDTWTVVGVIQDNDENGANLYVPSGVADGRASSVMVLMDKNHTVAYVKNSLKNAGIQESGYDFINISKSATVFGERLVVVCYIVLCAGLLVIVLMTGAWLLKKLHFYRGRMSDMYFSELTLRYRVDLIKTAGGILLFTAGIAAMLPISLEILGTCLSWQEVGKITGAIAAGDFGVKLAWLKDYQTLGGFLFGVCAVLILVGLILALYKLARKNNLAGGGGTLWRI